MLPEADLLGRHGYGALTLETRACAGEPKTLWVVPGAGHGEYYKVQPKEYKKRVVEFFDRYLRLTF